MIETPTATKVEPADGLAQLMALLNESQQYHDDVVTREGGNGFYRFYRRKSLEVPKVRDTKAGVSFSETACGLSMTDEERLLL